ncbi:MAG: IS1595 family transposase [Parvularculales bacterium]
MIYQEYVNSPGRAHRKGIGMVSAVKKFGDPVKAADWLADLRWPEERHCPYCGGPETSTATHKSMPYWCKDCRKYFSLKTGTLMASSRVPVEKWTLLAYNFMTNLKSISAMKIHRDLEVREATAWHMLHRMMEGFVYDDVPEEFATGTEFQVDECYIGGLEANKHRIDRIPNSHGGATKMIIIGITEKESRKVWMDVIPDTRSRTIARIIDRIIPEDSIIYTDEARHYSKVRRKRIAVNHSRKEYVKPYDAFDGMSRQASTNITESAWSHLTRSITGVHHKMSPKHLQRYVKAFAGRWNIRDLDTEEQMAIIFQRMLGHSLDYETLTSDNGLPSGSGKEGAYYPERRSRYTGKFRYKKQRKKA